MRSLNHIEIEAVSGGSAFLPPIITLPNGFPVYVWAPNLITVSPLLTPTRSQ
jgi:hypothetical protein